MFKLFFIHYKDLTPGRFIVMFCVAYTVVGFVYWIYERIGEHSKHIKLSEAAIYYIVQAVLWRANEIINSSNKSKFEEGRKSAYREVLGIINADFIHREVSYDRFNLDLFPHIINLISKGSELAIDEAEEYKDSEAGSFFMVENPLILR